MIVMAPRRHQISVSDPSVMTALNHPARLAVVEELYSGRVATSTELSEVAGISASAMSYHLRALAKLGLVERAPATRDGRQRPWRASGSGLSVNEFTTPEQRSAGSAVLRRMADKHQDELLAKLSSLATEPPAWQAVVANNNELLWMTADEAATVMEGINALLRPYRRRSTGRNGRRRVRISYSLVPR